MAPRSSPVVVDARAYAAGANATIGTVPAGEIWLVRDVSVQGTAALGGQVFVSLLRTGTAYPFVNGSTSTTTPLISSGRYVALVAGDSVRVTSVAAQTLAVFLSGAILLA